MLPIQKKIKIRMKKFSWHKTKILPIEVFARIDSSPLKMPKCTLLSIRPVTFKFIRGLSRECDIGFLVQIHSIVDGNKHLTKWNDKMF